VHLELEAGFEFVGEHPVYDLDGLDGAEDGGEKDGAAATGQLVLVELGAGPLVVLTGTDDEFDFVALGEVGDVGVEVAGGLAGGGGLEVDDAMDAGIDAGDVVGAAGLDEDGAAGIAEHAHEGKDVFLKKGLAACDLDEGAIKGLNLVEEVAEGASGAFVEGVGGVAVGAAEIAAGEADEGAAKTGPGALALDGKVDLVDLEGEQAGIGLLGGERG
jgi:hypothetical protein